MPDKIQLYKKENVKMRRAKKEFARKIMRCVSLAMIAVFLMPIVTFAMGLGFLQTLIIMSPHTHIARTTYGHTGNDGTLWSFLPGNERITGTLSNADFALIAVRGTFA